MLQDATPLVNLRAQDVLDGSVHAIVENAGESSARGERATLSIWRREGNDIRRIDGRDRTFAFSSASALVRLGIFAPLAMEDENQLWVVFNPLGLTTIDRAVEDDTSSSTDRTSDVR